MVRLDGMGGTVGAAGRGGVGREGEVVEREGRGESEEGREGRGRLERERSRQAGSSSRPSPRLLAPLFEQQSAGVNLCRRSLVRRQRSPRR